MSQTSAVSQNPSRLTPSPFTPTRLFYTFAAALMLVLTFIGFSKFFLNGQAYPGRPIAPPIKTLVIAHGSAMTAWLLLLLVQPLLILRNQRRLHMTLGTLGAALATLILILGTWLAIQSATVTPPEARIWGLPPKQFMAVPFISVWIFAAFVALGIAFRRKPAVHRPMMLLATLSAMSAAISRIDPLNNLYLGTVWERLFGPFALTLALGVLLLIIRMIITRAFDRWFTLGMTALIALDLFIWQIAPTPAWQGFATIFVP